MSLGGGGGGLGLGLLQSTVCTVDAIITRDKIFSPKN